MTQWICCFLYMTTGLQYGLDLYPVVEFIFYGVWWDLRFLLSVQCNEATFQMNSKYNTVMVKTQLQILKIFLSAHSIISSGGKNTLPRNTVCLLRMCEALTSIAIHHYC